MECDPSQDRPLIFINMGYDPSKGFYEKRTYSCLNRNHEGYIFRMRMDNKDDISSFQAQVVNTNKFCFCPV
jgi:hypothetical protein